MKSEIKLKVCGMKYPGNVRDVARLAPDYIGFIFYERSRRFVGDEFEMPKIPLTVKKIGVFVNAEAGNVLRKVKMHKLDLVQLHGLETADYCEKVSKSVKIIKSFGIDEEFDFSVLKKYDEFCDYYLFDAKSKEFGGTGTQFDWKILKKYKGKKPFFISGGIGPEDVEKIKQLKSQIPTLYGADVNSKFENEIALKDINKIEQFKDELSG